MPGEIAPAELQRLLAEDEPVRIVDIRSRRAFHEEHIPGSENLPFDVLTGAVERFAGEEHIVTVCPHGAASVQAARLIESFEGVPSGATVQSLAGGIEAWEGPLEAGAAADSTD